MTVFCEICGAFLICFGLIALLGMVWSWLLLPNLCSTTMVVFPEGTAEGLEQTVRGLLWLRRSGLWRGGIRVESRGLTAEGRAVLRRLSERYGLEISVCDIGDHT